MSIKVRDLKALFEGPWIFSGKVAWRTGVIRDGSDTPELAPAWLVWLRAPASGRKTTRWRSQLQESDEELLALRGFVECPGDFYF